MNYKQLLTNSMVVIGLSCFSSLAFAVGLTIHNTTNEPSTCKTAKGCSSDLLGAVGVTPAHSSRPYSDAKIRIACKDQLENCKADVYMSSNCTGPVVASATFALHGGLLGPVVNNGSKYAVLGTPGVVGADGNAPVTISYK